MAGFKHANSFANNLRWSKTQLSNQDTESLSRSFIQSRLNYETHM